MEGYIHSSLREELREAQTLKEDRKEAQIEKEDFQRKAAAQDMRELTGLTKPYQHSYLFNQQEARQLVKKQEMSNFDKLDDLMDMAVIQESPEVVRMKLAAETHNVSPRAYAVRNHILRQMKLDPITRQSLLQGEKSLHYVVDNFTEHKKRNNVAIYAARRLDDFWKLKESLKGDPVLGAEEKARMLYNLSKGYALSIATYKELYVDSLKDGKRKKDISALIERYYGLIEYFEEKNAGREPNPAVLKALGLTDSSAHGQIFGKDADVLTKARKQAHFLDQQGSEEYQVKTEEEAAIEAQELDKGLTYEQSRGVRMIDAYLGNLAATHKDKIPFISKIMSLSARERLFMYQAIERKGHLSAPKLTDAAISQFGYVPDFSRVKSALDRSTFRIWEAMKPDGLMNVHWDKLEAAFALVKDPAIAEAIRGYASFSSDHEEDITKPEPVEPAEGPLTEIEQRVRDSSITIFQQEADRNKCLQDAYQKLVECQEAVEKRDSSWFTTRWYRKRVADEKIDEAVKAMEALKLADRALGLTIDTTFRDADQQLADQKKKEALEKKANSGYTEEASKVKSDLLYAGAQTTTLLSKISLIPKFYTKEIGTVGTLEGLNAVVDLKHFQSVDLNGLLTGINITAGALGTMTGVIGAVGALGGIISTYKLLKNPNIAALDKSLAVAKTGKSVLSAAGAIGIGVTNIKFAGKVADVMMNSQTWSTAVGKMKTGLKFTGVALAGAGFAVDAFDIAVQARHEYHRKNALDSFSTVKTKLTARGTDEDLKKDLYITNLEKLDHRNKKRQAVGTGFSLLSNTISMSAALASSAGVGVALAGGALAVSIAGKVTDYLMKRSSQKKTVNEFLNLEDLSWLTKDGTKLFDGKEIKEPKTKEEEAAASKQKKLTAQLKESLLNHMAAELGFATFAGFYKHIVDNYAAFLYDNLFWNSEREVIYGEAPLTDYMVQGCYEFIKGLGLSVKYPPKPKPGQKYTDEELLKLRRPPKAAIANKLGG